MKLSDIMVLDAAIEIDALALSRRSDAPTVETLLDLLAEVVVEDTTTLLVVVRTIEVVLPDAKLTSRQEVLSTLETIEERWYKAGRDLSWFRSFFVTLARYVRGAANA